MMLPLWMSILCYAGLSLVICGHSVTLYRHIHARILGDTSHDTLLNMLVDVTWLTVFGYQLIGLILIPYVDNMELLCMRIQLLQWIALIIYLCASDPRRRE